MRSGQSLSLAQLNLKGQAPNQVTVSVVYPADATPGHLLSVVPNTQLAMLKQRQERLQAARKAEAAAKARNVRPATPPPAVTTKSQPTKETPAPKPATTQAPLKPKVITAPPPPPVLVAPRGGLNPMPPAMIMPQRVNSTLEQRYREAIKAQQEWLRRLQGR